MTQLLKSEEVEMEYEQVFEDTKRTDSRVRQEKYLIP